MKLLTKSRLITALICAVLCVIWLSMGGPSVSGKGKPGGGGGGGSGSGGPGQNGGGDIYFSYKSKLYTMKDDGSGVTQVVKFPRQPYGEPSRLKHAGKRWIVQRQPVLGEPGPDWYWRQEFVALSDTGDEVSLHIAPDIDPVDEGRWCIGDGWISWIGRRWDNDPLSPNYGEILDGGLYVTELAFDEQGNITGVASPSVLLVPLPLVDVYPDGIVPDIVGHDWAPDGSALVFSTKYDHDLVIADLVTESFFTVLTDGMSYVESPRWSPAGDKFLIRYKKSDNSKWNAYVVNIDGSGLTLLEAAKGTTHPEVGVWSPTGSHLLYQHADQLHDDTYIVRTKADGSGNTRLTDKSMGDGFNSPFPLGWRE